ncbi:unnamed protein product [Thelazia callipaeda]|uniref:Ricin B-type lectin domain-containing protein n=1 Tax=Thelazia callipaeda TaxID=103827 RepID=A0A0N5CV88_THECL|nr:unnamed protein product [Thelazia callipaeda]
MLETLVAKVLNNYLGEYLENLNTDQLNIALLQGQVELENVPLKKSALRKFDIPLQVKSGLLGKLTLSVPLTRLRSEPWIIKMSDLLVLLEPSSFMRYDVENVELYEQAKKEQQLEDLEKSHRQLLNYMGLPKLDGGGGQNWWGASLVSTIINNIKLVLTNVHIRYEDANTLMDGASFTCGIRIHNIIMQTTDSNWAFGYMQPQEGVSMFKKLDIQRLSVYWNSRQHVTEEIKNFMELQYMMGPETNKDYVCILHPFSADVLVERNTSKIPLNKYPYIPRFKFSLRPEKVIIELSKRQIWEMTALGKDWARFDRSRQHRKWRPLTTIGENAKEWWNFAYNRVQDKERERKTRHTWSFAYNRAKQLNAYCRAYRRRLLSHLEAATISATGHSDKFKENLSVEDASDHDHNDDETIDEAFSSSLDSAPTTSSKKMANSEDTVLMKQIERDSGYTYHELELFREIVYRRIRDEKKTRHSLNEGGLQSDDQCLDSIGFRKLNFQIEKLIVRTVFHHDSENDTRASNSQSEEPTKNSSGGLYTWLSNWMYGPQKISHDKSKAKKQEDDEEILKFSLNEKENLSTDLTLVEKQVEDEILDVLNDSQDDSAVLYRDTLLAEIKMKIGKGTVRFIDDSEVIAMDLWHLASSVRLSPRCHVAAVSLSVTDMSLQRLRNFSEVDKTAENTQNDKVNKDGNESLMFGFGESKNSTQILFAIGKAGKISDSNSFSDLERKELDTLFRMVYRRCVSKMVVTHTLSARCDKLSILCNEDAFDDLTIFWNEKDNEKWAENSNFMQSQVISVIDFGVHCPQLNIELRSKRADLLKQKSKSATSTPFALLDVKNIAVGVSNREKFNTRIDVAFSSLEIKDLFEPTNDLLLCIKKHLSSFKEQLSTSCPSLNEDICSLESRSFCQRARGYSVGSSPIAFGLKKDEFLNRTSQTDLYKWYRSIDHHADCDGESHFSFSFAMKEHSLLESCKKISCSINVGLPSVEICMNRRSYTMLIDFLGYLEPKVKLLQDNIGVPLHSSRSETNIALQCLEPYNMSLNIHVSLLQIWMNYPKNKSSLGVLKGEDVYLSAQAKIYDEETPLVILLSLLNCSLSDNTPFYSELYNERLCLRNLSTDNDSTPGKSCGWENQHRFPSRATLEITKYLCAKSVAEKGHDMSFVLKVPKEFSFAYIHTNRYLSALLDFWQQFFELTDIVYRTNACDMNIPTYSDGRSKIQITCEVECSCTFILPLNQLSNQVLIGETASIRIDNKFQSSSTILDFQNFEIGNFFGCERLCRDMFQQFHFLSSRRNVFSKSYDLVVNAYYNLDVALSHNVPDLSITTTLQNLNVKVTTDFYRLLRGVLSMNLGDQLGLSLETIPIELLEKPTEVDKIVGAGNKYTSFSFRMTLTNVEIDCYIPSENLLQGFTPFAGIKLNSSRISFDVYIDNQSELDLICESTELIDTRFIGKDLSDEVPMITLVLLNARVLLFLDWLIDMKNFILLNADFIPPVEEEYRCVTQSTKLGIVHRNPSNRGSIEKTFSLKITLKECDLILLEDPRCAQSLALVAHATAVLYMNDIHGQLNGDLEVQRINVDWFVMSSEKESRCQLTNDFSMTFSLRMEGNVDSDELHSRLGLSSVLSVKHRLTAEVNDLIARISYRDFCVIRNVLFWSFKKWMKSAENSIIRGSRENVEKNIDIVHLIIKSNHISFWMLDDHLGAAFPLIRCKFKKFCFDRYLTNTDGSFIFAADYFNQNLFGWEPLIEDWYLKQLSVVAKDNALSIDLLAEERSTLNFNITQVFLHQALHSMSVRSRSDHLPYILYNETGSHLRFTTAVDEIMLARSAQRQFTVKWYQTAPDASTTFEFPVKRLTIAEDSEEIRKLIVRVDGWDEVSPVNVDAVGTYFRLARYSNSRSVSSSCGMNVRLVIAVTMDNNGRKVVTIRSALTLVNHLHDPILLILTSGSLKSPETKIIRVDPKKTLQVPLRFANAMMAVKPDGWSGARAHEVKWQEAKVAGERVNKLLKICVSIKREHYPEYETLSGHTISFASPLSVLNLLPVDAELQIAGRRYAVSASKQIQITSVDLNKNINFEVFTDRFVSVGEFTILRSLLVQKSGDIDRIHLRMQDSKKRCLDMYCSLNIGCGGTVLLALWVPYWIVNKSGVPLIIKQEATTGVAAGQMEEHEKAKDRNPLMFSFANENCPKQCTLRVGQNHESDKGYKPLFGPKFPLTVGLHSMKLRLIHNQKPARIYNIGVEVRQGTGRYKDTQVVMLTPRYVLDNQTSFGLSLSNISGIDEPDQHVKIPSKSSLIWNENFEDTRMVCVKRDDVKYWSCPIRIDLISSFHVTMRDVDETPQFLRVEVLLSSAIFYVTFTDVHLYPPPIQLQNLSDVPSSHLRTICKARSTVDYAWDDHYAPKLLILQVFENKSNCYDPQKPGMGPPLVYTNDIFIKYAHSFERKVNDGYTDEIELTLEVMSRGKVILNKLNPSGTSSNQLWRFAQDGCLENIGMNNRAKPGQRYVLDVLENDGFVLMMLKRNSGRNLFQKWRLTQGNQLRCLVEGMFVEARKADVVLAAPNKKSTLNAAGIPIEQVWELQSQRPGSGVLDVECLHKGPTLVVRITDRARLHNSVKEHCDQTYYLKSLSVHSNANMNSGCNFDLNISMRNGIGLSFINGLHEELIYARFQGIVLHINRQSSTYQVTGSVEADNQLLSTDRWQVLFCQQDAVNYESGFVESPVLIPALKLEMNCTPLKHYDAFDCFRLKLCDLSVQLDETLLWKIVQFVQKSEAAESMKPDVLSQPPNTELDKLDRVQARRCYFGTLELEIGAVALSVLTVSGSGLSPELRKLKQHFNIKLVSFENATISLTPFRQYRYFETFSFLIETLSKFYLEELKNQTFNIIVTMDAFGNPLGLASNLKESFEELLFEGNLGGFVSGLGYGVTNSISKVASSMATGVGALTFDERHDLMRRRMLRCQPQVDSNTALAHLYCGVKGLGVGVLGGLTAMMTNVYNESRKDGFTGAVRGITTGAVDTVTKPMQGIFDLVEGTASAVKEMVGGPSTKKSHFPPHRVRLPRVTMSLQSLLPCYSEELAYAQLELLRINGFATNEMLLDVEMLLNQGVAKDRVRQYALICSEQCYIVRQISFEPSSVVQRIPYKQLKLIQAVPVSEENGFVGTIEVIIEISSGRKQRLPHIWCSRFDVAKKLCEKVSQAKQLYDHGKRTLNVVDEFDVV